LMWPTETSQSSPPKVDSLLSPPSHHPTTTSVVPPKVSKVQLSSVGTDDEEIVSANSGDTQSTSSVSTQESAALLVDLLMHPILCDIEYFERRWLMDEDLGYLCCHQEALVPPWPLVGRCTLLHGSIGARLWQIVAAPEFEPKGHGGRSTLMKDWEGELHNNILRGTANLPLLFFSWWLLWYWFRVSEMAPSCRPQLPTGVASHTTTRG
jgi:hypothetical protein